jgi:hypothetical protein
VFLRHIRLEHSAQNTHSTALRGEVANGSHDILLRTKGKIRAAVKIGLMNLTYNMRRLEFLLRPQSVCGTG